MDVSGTQSCLQLNSVQNSNDSEVTRHSLILKANAKTHADKGDVLISCSKHRSSSPAPFALHTDGHDPSRNGLHLKNNASAVTMRSATPSARASSPSLRAPYAQPVLDASKVNSTSKKVNTSVDERISFVRERRLQQQQIIGIFQQDSDGLDENFNARRLKEEASRVKWEQSQDEKKKKLEEMKEKEMQRRKEVEDRKHKQIQEEKQRAVAIVARTDQQAEVVLRKKRSSSVDKTKRWSWGVGGYGGGGGVATEATHIPTAPSPFHYFDATQLTKRASFHGDEDEERNSISTSTSILTGSSKTEPATSFSKSPFVMNTSHMKFANGLRSYGSSPTQSLDKSFSPASAKSRRSRSVDIRKNKRSSSKESLQSIDKTAPAGSSTARGRSPATRETLTWKSKGHSSPQPTEPINISTRLLAPTKASMARSKHDSEESSGSTHANTPLRSRSIDRKRPSSAKSDASSSSSTVSSPRVQNDKPKTKSKRDPSPLLEKKQKPPSPKAQSSVTVSSGSRPQSPLSRPRRAPSPIPSLTSTPKEAKKRSPSPFKSSPGSNKSSSSFGTKTTPARNVVPSSKSTPPVIKQTLRPTKTPSRPKSSFSPAAIAKSLSDKLSRKTTKRTGKRMEESGGDVNVTVTLSSGHDGNPESVKKLNTTFTVSPPLNTSASHQVTTPPEASVVKDYSKEEVANENKSQEDSHQLLTENTKSSPLEELSKEVVASESSSQEQSTAGSEFVPIAFSIEDANKDAIILGTDVADSDLHLFQDNPKEAILVSNPENSLADEIRETEVANKVLHMEDQKDTSSEIVDATNDKTPSSQKEEEVEEGTTKQEQSISSPVPQTPEVQTDTKAIELSEKAIVEAQEEIQDEDQASHYDSTIHQEEKISTVADDTNQADETSQAPSTDQAGPPSTADNLSAAACGKQEVDDENLEANESGHSKASPIIEAKPSEDTEDKQAPKNDSPSEKSSSSEDQKKKEKKVSPEEQAYKDAIAAKRKEMKEKREREEKERQERLKLEAEEQAKREEDARRMAEEAKMEQEKLEEEERVKKEELEKKKKMEAEEIARKHEEFMKEQREKAEQKAREEAERLRKDREIAAQKKEEERLARKKRLEMIMRRTRGGDSPTNNLSSSNTPTGGQSPANVTPIGGRSPQNISPTTVETKASDEPSYTLQTSNPTSAQEVRVAPSSGDAVSIDIATIPLEASSNLQVNGSHLPQKPFIAFEDNVKVNGSLQNNFVPIDGADLTLSNDPDLSASVSLKTPNHVVGLESGDTHPLGRPMEDTNEVPTGNLLEL